MEKMKLMVEDLAVDSFEVAAAALPVGTVHGRAGDDGAYPPVDTTVQGNPTCLIGVCTCWYTCQGCTEAASCACPVDEKEPVRQPLGSTVA